VTQMTTITVTIVKVEKQLPPSLTDTQTKLKILKKNISPSLILEKSLSIRKTHRSIND